MNHHTDLTIEYDRYLSQYLKYFIKQRNNYAYFNAFIDTLRGRQLSTATILTSPAHEFVVWQKAAD
jgi:hypothetical protein